FAVWQNDGQLTVIERDGAPIAPFAGTRHASLPLVVGKGAPQAASAFVAKVAQRPALAAKVSGYVRVGERRWDLQVDGRIRVMLPEAGVYLLFADVRGVVTPASSGSVFVFARLFNVTDNAPVPATHRLVIRAEDQAEAVGGIQSVAAVGGAATIRLEARLAGVTGSSGGVFNKTNGRTALGYVRIA
ncbi:MAG: cell division protein FtsQ/DivIB, partial [Caldilineaceae bacterium]|nr:cell division protein FtsQ/DivIB [Caldilineaceae bacterium]